MVDSGRGEAACSRRMHLDQCGCRCAVEPEETAQLRTREPRVSFGSSEDDTLHLPLPGTAPVDVFDMSNTFVHAVMPDGSRPHVCLFACVTITVRIPLLPDFIDVNTATGRFVAGRDRDTDGGDDPAPT